MGTPNLQLYADRAKAALEAGNVALFQEISDEAKEVLREYLKNNTDHDGSVWLNFMQQIKNGMADLLREQEELVTA